ncbi:tripartite motif-containing protein 2-like [Patiria miniata]|uniref:Uncharacterized protein n=1 Tax=Patiria miniata TaxID=46514 RepID=A0A914AGK4_PATMI|nr:tripartite motif-containing protein 2-like [Patiria miniata]
MATSEPVSTAVEKIKRHRIECSICHERYQQPKILECLHSFCGHCLLKYYSTKHQGSTTFSCPVCLQETKLLEAGVQGLQTNFHLIGLVEELALQEKIVGSADIGLLCDICEGGKEATQRCLDCGQNSCSVCSKIHLRFASSSNHQVAPLDDIREGKVTLVKNHKRQHPKCPTHEGEVARFFCTTCKMLICRDCAVVNHCKPEHSYVETDEATSVFKQSFAELFTPLENSMMELQKARENVSRMKEHLGVTARRITTEVKDRADEIRAEVTAQENRILDAIQNIQTDREQKLDECEKTMGLAEERIRYSLDTAREVAGTASGSDFLSLQPTISKGLKILAGQKTPRVDDRLVFLTFEKNEVVGDINLGRLVVGGKWELCREFGRKGRGPKEFNVAWGIAARHPDEIAVTDYHNKRVVVSSIDGNQKTTIKLQGYPRGIAATRTDNRLVVVEERASNVKVFNSDNTLAFEFPTVLPNEAGKPIVNLQSVAIKNDGAIVVGDVRRNVLTEHSPSDGQLLRTIRTRIKPYFLAVDSRDRFVSSELSQVVHVANDNGTTNCSIKPTINGKQVKQCNGIYTDNSGFYVSMFNGINDGHIHHYDHQGGFIKCIAQALHSPWGIALTSNGQLAVADQFSVKIYHQV